MTQTKLPVSAVIITKNEEHNIEDCLRSVGFCSEIIVVDSFSTDKTVEIAKRFTDRVVQREWQGINNQREFAKGLAKNEWVLDLDADERISPELAAEVAQLNLDDKSVDGYFIPRRAFYLGRWIKHGGWYPDYKMRLYRREKARFIDNDPHDTVEFSGNTAALRGTIHHFTYRGISDQLRQINSFSTARAELLRRKGRQFNIFQLLFRPLWKFFNTYILKSGFLDGRAGFIISVLSSYHVFATWAKLWELNSKTSSQPPASNDRAE